jgi:Zn-dependent metalloprotease
MAERDVLLGASTDVVAHEVGHGLLDSARPDSSTSILEVGAFHEAFGDCIAMLTALRS